MGTANRVRVETLTADLALEISDTLIAMIANSPWDNWTTEHLLADRPEKWLRSIVAFSEGRPAGWAVVSRRAESSHLHHLVVAPAMRGKGIGTALMAILLERNRDAEKMTLKVHASNAAAARFYRRLGFVENNAIPSPSEYMEFARSTLEPLKG